MNNRAITRRQLSDIKDYMTSHGFEFISWLQYVGFFFQRWIVASEVLLGFFFCCLARWSYRKKTVVVAVRARAKGNEKILNLLFSSSRFFLLEDGQIDYARRGKNFVRPCSNPIFNCDLKFWLYVAPLRTDQIICYLRVLPLTGFLHRVYSARGCAVLDMPRSFKDYFLDPKFTIFENFFVVLHTRYAEVLDNWDLEQNVDFHLQLLAKGANLYNVKGFLLLHPAVTEDELALMLKKIVSRKSWSVIRSKGAESFLFSPKCVGALGGMSTAMLYAKQLSDLDIKVVFPEEGGPWRFVDNLKMDARRAGIVVD